MYKYSDNKNDFLYILNNLRDEDLEELSVIWKDNWKEKVLETLSRYKVIVLYGKNNLNENVPIAMGGFCEESENACVWLLTTKFVALNQLALIKVLREQILLGTKRYKIMYNFIYKRNFQAKKWLKKLGFCFDNPKPEILNVRDDFEFFYKLGNGKE